MTIFKGIFTAVLITVTVLASNAQEQKTTIMENNKKIIQTGFDQWANHTGSFFDLLADDLQWTITGSTPLSKTYTSKNNLWTK